MTNAEDTFIFTEFLGKAYASVTRASLRLLLYSWALMKKVVFSLGKYIVNLIIFLWEFSNEICVDKKTNKKFTLKLEINTNKLRIFPENNNILKFSVKIKHPQ